MAKAAEPPVWPLWRYRLSTNSGRPACPGLVLLERAVDCAAQGLGRRVSLSSYELVGLYRRALSLMRNVDGRQLPEAFDELLAYLAYRQHEGRVDNVGYEATGRPREGSALPRAAADLHAALTTGTAHLRPDDRLIVEVLSSPPPPELVALLRREAELASDLSRVRDPQSRLFGTPGQ